MAPKPAWNALAGASTTAAHATATGAPWWATLTAVVLTAAASTALTALSTLFPQNSADRLAWWTTYLNRRTHADLTAGPAPTTTRHLVSAREPWTGRHGHRYSHETAPNHARPWTPSPVPQANDWSWI